MRFAAIQPMVLIVVNPAGSLDEDLTLHALLFGQKNQFALLGDALWRILDGLCVVIGNGDP